MRVIRNGLESPKSAIVTCLDCNSELEVTRNDAKSFDSDRDGAYYVFGCAVCSREFLVARTVVGF